MTKAQAHRSHKLAGYYTRQYAVTAANKARQAAKRREDKLYWKAQQAAVQ